MGDGKGSKVSWCANVLGIVLASGTSKCRDGNCMPVRIRLGCIVICNQDGDGDASRNCVLSTLLLQG